MASVSIRPKALNPPTLTTADSRKICGILDYVREMYLSHPRSDGVGGVVGQLCGSDGPITLFKN